MKALKKFGKWVGKNAKVLLPIAGVAVGLAAGPIGGAIGNLAGKIKAGKDKLETVKSQVNEKTGGFLGIGDGEKGVLGIGTGNSRKARIEKDDELRKEYERQKLEAQANGKPAPPPPPGLSEGLPWGKILLGVGAALILPKLTK